MWTSMPSAVLILLSITCQWISRTNADQVLTSYRSDSRLRPNAGATLKLKRDVLDTIYDSSCTISWRTTGSLTVCTCKPSYGTVMTKPGKEWNCNTPKEVGCAYSLDTISETNVHVITNSTKVVPIFSEATDEDLSIKSISIWNRPSKSQVALWDEVTDVAITYFTLHREADATTTPQPTTTVTTAEPHTTMISTTKPKTTKSATTKPKTTKLVTTKRKSTKSATTKPKTTKSTTTKPKTTKLATTKPKTTKLATTKPKTTKLTTTKPKTTKLTTTKPTTTRSTTTKPKPKKSATAKSALFYTNVVKSKTSLMYKIALDLWAGHVIKIQFGQGNKCALAKLKGQIHYPINITEFKKKIEPKPEPTIKPVPTSKPEPTTKPVPTKKTTKSTPTVGTPTTITTASTKKYKQSSTVGIVIGVILGLILLITVSTFVYRRRKSSKGKSNDISIKNMNHYENPMAEIE